MRLHGYKFTRLKGVHPDNEYANSGEFVTAAMRDWIVKCEQKLARLVTCAVACACFAPSAHAFSLDDTQSVSFWEMVITVTVISAFFASVLIWIYSAHRRLKLRQRRRAKFASAALNNLPHGIVMVDAWRRIVFCNDTDYLKRARRESPAGLGHGQADTGVPLR